MIRSLFGVAVLLGLAVLLSEDRTKISKRVVGWGIGLQFLLATLILRTEVGLRVFEGAKVAVLKLLGFSDVGAAFLFGNLYRGDPGVIDHLPPGAMQGPAQILDAGTGAWVDLGTIFAIHVLPTIVFFASLMSVLYHLRVMQKLVRVVGWVMMRTMGTSGAESLSAAANIFVGQTEAPLVVRPYVERMTRSELMAIMTGGFATVAGGVLAAYVKFGIDAGHLMAASLMSAPAALVVAKIMIPERDVPETGGHVAAEPERETVNVIEAAAVGAADGLKLALNVGAMLMAYIALVAMVDAGIGAVAGLTQIEALEGLTLARILGWIFAPLAFAMGVEASEIVVVGQLLGTKISINEFLAYIQLSGMEGELSAKSYMIATYALCGFANFSSIAIQLGGIGGIAPGRRQDLARLGLRAMAGGALASFLTATIAGGLL